MADAAITPELAALYLEYEYGPLRRRFMLKRMAELLNGEEAALAMARLLDAACERGELEALAGAAAPRKRVARAV